MFKQSPESQPASSSETIIGPSVKIEGELKAVGNVSIEGLVTGSVSTDKDVLVGEKAVIVADVRAQNATIAGQVKGSIQISGHLTLRPSAKVQGDINTKTIAIESGAQINGQLVMGGPVANPNAPKMEDKK